MDVSQLYSDASTIYFKDFQSDLKEHFSKYMRSDVFQLADIDQNYTVVKFDTDISDVRAGRPIPQIPGMISTGNKPDLSVRSAYAIFAKEVRKKRENLKEQGLWDNEVIIEDIETDPDQP